MTRNPYFALAASLVAVQTVHADPFYSEQTDPGYAPARSGSIWRDDAIGSGIGVGVQAGGGVTGFVDSSLRNTTGTVGGMWSFRAALGTHTPLAVELGYMGSATPIQTELGRADALMLGTTLETALRFTLMPKHTWSPYAFAGIGWQRYSIDDTAFQLSDVGIGNQDDLVVFPLGVGVAYRVGPVVTDVRGAFRAARGEDLVIENPELALETGIGGYAPMHTWDASLNVGYEF